MRRTIALFLLTLANIVLLVHAIAPHHHHHLISLEATATQHDHAYRIHDNNFTHHIDGDILAQDCCNSRNHSESESCSLEHVYTRVNNEKQSTESLDTNFSLLPCMVMFYAGDPIPSANITNGLPFSQKPYLRSYHSQYISQSLGLRAPPIC